MRSYQIVFTQVNHTLNNWCQYCYNMVDGWAVSTCIFTVSYNQLAKSSDEMSTKTSGILVLLSVIWCNFGHSFYFRQRSFSFSRRKKHWCSVCGLPKWIMDSRAQINKRFSTVKGDIFIVYMQVTSMLMCSYFRIINKEYLSTRQIFFFDLLTAVSAAHVDANIVILRQTVQN